MGITKAIAAGLLASFALSAFAQTRPLHKSHPQAITDDDRAVDALKDAESLLQKQQYQQAEEKLQAIVTQQSENPQVWFDLGFAQSHLGKITEAIAAYKKATQLSPKWFEAQQNLGLALAKSGDLTAAASALKFAVALKPTVGGQQALAAAWLSLAQVRNHLPLTKKPLSSIPQTLMLNSALPAWLNAPAMPPRLSNNS
jgi:tetratricopeptide (TPR) repeat protein